MKIFNVKKMFFYLFLIKKFAKKKLNLKNKMFEKVCIVIKQNNNF